MGRLLSALGFSLGAPGQPCVLLKTVAATLLDQVIVRRPRSIQDVSCFAPRLTPDPVGFAVCVSHFSFELRRHGQRCLDAALPGFDHAPQVRHHVLGYDTITSTNTIISTMTVASGTK